MASAAVAETMETPILGMLVAYLSGPVSATWSSAPALALAQFGHQWLDHALLGLERVHVAMHDIQGQCLYSHVTTPRLASYPASGGDSGQGLGFSLISKVSIASLISHIRPPQLMLITAFVALADLGRVLL